MNKTKLLLKTLLITSIIFISAQFGQAGLFVFTWLSIFILALRASIKNSRSTCYFGFDDYCSVEAPYFKTYYSAPNDYHEKDFHNDLYYEDFDFYYDIADSFNEQNF